MSDLPPLLTSDPPPLPPFWDGGPPPIDRAVVTPTVEDVAALERTRTIGTGGEDVGTFTTETHPTDGEVEALIDEALDVVLDQLPDHIDPLWYAPIRRVVALRAAVSLDTSYYREQSPASAWSERFAADLAALQAAIPHATWIS
jgi:hypothetical protein